MFEHFGDIVDLISSQKFHLRGQAWIVFDDPQGAGLALEKMQNALFYGRPMVRIKLRWFMGKGGCIFSNRNSIVDDSFVRSLFSDSSTSRSASRTPGLRATPLRSVTVRLFRAKRHRTCIPGL